MSYTICILHKKKFPNFFLFFGRESKSFPLFQWHGGHELYREEFISAKCDWNKYGFVKEYGVMYLCTVLVILSNEVQNLTIFALPLTMK
jgi:hypothetical protein